MLLKCISDFLDPEQMIDIKQMQVDHIQPHWHTITEQESKKYNITKGSHNIENLNPSCSRCNKWKSTYDLEQFRKVIETSLMRLNRDTPNFRLARDYGLLTETPKQIKFYLKNECKCKNTRTIIALETRAIFACRTMMLNQDEGKIKCAVGNREICFWQGKKA